MTPVRGLATNVSGKFKESYGPCAHLTEGVRRRAEVLKTPIFRDMDWTSLAPRGSRALRSRLQPWKLRPMLSRAVYVG